MSRSRLGWIFLGPLLAGLWAAVGWAQLSLSVLSPQQTAAPGDFVTLVFEITNLGAAEDTFEFELILPEGLSPLMTPGPLTLSAGSSETIFITVFVSSKAQAGPNEVTLRATSLSDPTISAEATAVIVVEEVPAVEVIPPPEREVEPGQIISLPFEVINRGNALDRFALTAEDLRGFPIELELESVELLPGERRTVSVTVSVPSQAAPGRDQVTMTARSVVFGVEAAATVRLTILPPPPEAVGGTLYLEVPTALEFTFSGAAGFPIAFLEDLSGSATFGQAGEIDYEVQIRNLTELRTLVFNLERARFGTTLGDMTLSLAQLIELSGRGVRLTAKAGPLSSSRATLAAVADPSGEPVFGGEAALDWGSFVTALSGRFRPAREEILADAALTTLVPGLAELTAEGALSRDLTSFDRAAFVKSLSHFGELEVSGELVYAGSDFLGARRDEAGVLLTQSANFGGISLQGRFSHFRDNVSGDPALPTTLDTRVRAAARLPLAPWPSLSAQFDYHSRTNPIPPFITALGDFHLGVRITQQAGPLMLSGSYERRRSRDPIAGTDLLQTTWRSDADLRAGPLLTLFRLELITQKDLISGLTLEHFLGTLVSAKLRFPAVDLSFSVERLPTVTNLTAEIEAQLGRLTITAMKELRIEDSGEVRFSLSTSMALHFDLPIPFIKTKGRLEGFVFIDEDGDGLRDSDEPGVSRLILSLDGTQARTDGEEIGFYRFPPLEPGVYQLTIENLPAGLVSLLPLPLEIELRAGEVRHLDLPLGRVAAIRGLVFIDEDKDGERDADERGLADVKLVATGPQGEQKSAFTLADGTFLFDGLAPGSWRVTLDTNSLPPRFEPTTPTQIEVELHSGEMVEIVFGVVEVPPAIRFSPTADFSFTPERPKAGEPVSFDASASFDPDGQIVKYEWDFDGDGITDSEGMIVSFIFEAPGDYPVTLTVTDDDGLTGTKTKTVTVVPP